MEIRLVYLGQPLVRNLSSSVCSLASILLNGPKTKREKNKKHGSIVFFTGNNLSDNNALQKAMQSGLIAVQAQRCVTVCVHGNHFTLLRNVQILQNLLCKILVLNYSLLSLLKDQEELKHHPVPIPDLLKDSVKMVLCHFEVPIMDTHSSGLHLFRMSIHSSFLPLTSP